MPKIYQVFELDLKKMHEISAEELARLDFPKASQRLIQDLKAKGYNVLVSSGASSGLPTSLITIGEFPGRDAKMDFHEIEAKLLGSQWFGSGEVYLEIS